MRQSRFRSATTLCLGLIFAAALAACGGRSGSVVPSTPGATGASAGGTISAAVPGVRSAAATPNPIYTTLYTKVAPLSMVSVAGVIDFDSTPVTVPTIWVPLDTGAQSTNELIIPITCALPVQTLSTRRVAAAASATPQPTPTPAQTATSCVIIVEDASGNDTQIAGPATTDGTFLYFPESAPSISYTIGASYSFYIAIGQQVLVTPSPAPTSTAAAPTPSPVPTATPRQTATPRPTATPCPTPTPRPTPRPTPTPTPAPGTWCHGSWHDGRGEHYGYYYKHRDGSEWSHDENGCDHNGRHGDEPDGGPSCGDDNDHDRDGGYGDSRHSSHSGSYGNTRHQDDNGNQKDCGEHTGEGHNDHGGDYRH